MEVVQVIQANRADPYFSFCFSDDGCPMLSQLVAPTPVAVPVSTPPVPPPAPSEVQKAQPKPDPHPRSANAALRTVDFRGGLDAFLVKARDEELPASARPLLEHWLKAKDQPGSRYLVIVHTEDSGPISRKLAQDRGDAVTQAIHQLLPPKQLDRTSVFDPTGRQVVVVIEPPVPVSPTPTSAASLAPPPKPNPAPLGEGKTEKSP